MFSNQAFLVKTGVGPSDLLWGLEGYPAKELTDAFNSSSKKFYIVNKNSDDLGSENEQGTLRYCVEAAKNASNSQMTWIIFDPQVFPVEANESIELRDVLDVSSNTIIDGRGAKVTIHTTLDNHLIRIRDAKNVILKNLILHKVAPYARSKAGLEFPLSDRAGFDPVRALQGIDGDGFAFRGTCDNVWIDHCTFFLCGDEAIGVMSSKDAYNTKVTVSWCDFSDQYYVALVGHTEEEKQFDEKIRFTFHHNKAMGTARRSPRVNRATADVYNNYLQNWIDWGMAANASSKVLVEGNIFEADQSTIAMSIGTGSHIKGFVRTKNNSLINGAQLDSYMPQNVQTPYYYRTVSQADEDLKTLLNSECGWLNIRISRHYSNRDKK